MGMEVAEVFGIFTVFHLSVRRLYIFYCIQKDNVNEGKRTKPPVCDFSYVLLYFKTLQKVCLWFPWHLCVCSQLKREWVHQSRILLSNSCFWF